VIERQGLERFLSDSVRKQLLGNQDLSPERHAKLLQKATRNLITNPEFLRTAKQATKAFAQLGKALQQLNSLR
jgi:hypothetical protein